MEELKKLSKKEWQEKIKELLENGYRAEASFLIASLTIEHGGFPNIYNMEEQKIKDRELRINIVNHEELQQLIEKVKKGCSQLEEALDELNKLEVKIDVKF